MIVYGRMFSSSIQRRKARSFERSPASSSAARAESRKPNGNGSVAARRRRRRTVGTRIRNASSVSSQDSAGWMLVQ